MTRFSPGFIKDGGIPSSLLLHFEGADGSATGVGNDSSGNSYNFNNDGSSNVVFDDDMTAPPFGTSAALFDNTAWLKGGTAGQGMVNALNWRTDDFTIDFWIMLQAAKFGFNQIIMDNRPGVEGAYAMIETVDVNWRWRVNSGNIINVNAGMVHSAWRHLAFTRASGTLRAFIQGVKFAEVTDNTDYTSQPSLPYLGSANGGGGATLLGWLKEFHVLQGAAVWTADFTPPAAPYQ